MPSGMAAKLDAEVTALAVRRRLAPAALVAEWVRTAQPGMAAESALADLQPDHRAYVRTQNLVSILVERLTQMPALGPVVRVVSPVQRHFAARRGSHVPLSKSFFSYWAFFDASPTIGGETLGTCILALSARLRLDGESIRIVRLMQNSRMGFFEWRGASGSMVRLRDLATGDEVRAFDPVACPGQPGQVWYTRVLPAPLRGEARHVMVTTPYIVDGVEPDDARRFIADAVAALATDGADHDAGGAAALLKYGPQPAYWPGYVLAAYRGHRTDAILLEGLPAPPRARGAARAGPRAWFPRFRARWGLGPRG